MRIGIATLPLHFGRAPRWLFEKMTKLAREISTILVAEFGAVEYLKKISDPFWFQTLGCVLGFDWHSSGVTTTTCGAIKEGLKPLMSDLGLFVCGGKGKTSRQTPSEIQAFVQNYHLPVDDNQLVYASKMAAKIDNNALQDGFQLYHHSFFFTKSGQWAVIQQGMKDSARTGYSGLARRYHWLSDHA